MLLMVKRRQAKMLVATPKRIIYRNRFIYRNYVEQGCDETDVKRSIRKRIMNKKSRVWNYFYKESDTVATCCLCNKNYSRKGRGTTCLRNHLKSKHPGEFQTMSDIDMKYLVKTEMNDGASSHSHLQLQTADPLEVQRHGNSDETHACDEKLALMIVHGDHSFNIIKGIGFINFVKALQPQYKINTISYYENIICQDIYQRLQSQLKHQLTMFDSVSLATSLWWHPSGQGLLSLCCYGIFNDFQSKQFHLKCEALSKGLSPSDIACRIRNIISNASLELQLPKEKIHCVVRDEETCTRDSIIGCSVHLLQLCVKYAIESNEHLKQLNSKCLQMAKHFQQSQISYNNLKYIHEKRLNREPFDTLMETDINCVKWTSIFRLKSNLLKLKDALSIYAEEYNMVKIYPDEWLDIELCNRVIQPIEEIINIWGDSTASSVIPLIAALRESLRTDVHNFVSSVTVCSFARKLLEELESKCSSMTTDIKYLMATYLDPRYKQAFFTQQEAQLVTDEVLAQLSRVQHHVWQPLITMNKTIPNPNTKMESKIDSFLDNMLTIDNNNSSEASTSFHSQSQLKNLLYLYNSEPRIERQSDPLSWWKSNPKYTALFPIVRKYLSIPAASIASERLFCISTNLYSDMKAGLCLDNVSKILFVKANLKALDQL